MEFGAIFLLLICYAAAGFATWQQRNPIYIIALLAGHISAYVIPLWQVLYSGSARLDLAVLGALREPIPFWLVLGSGWYYPLPALLVLYLYLTRWWFPGFITGLLTFLVFLFYHLLADLVGLRPDFFVYSAFPIPFGIPGPIFSSLMAALVSYGLLYALLASYRYAWISMALAVLPAALLLSLLVYGLLGAPLWIALLLQGEAWAVTIGVLSSLGLVGWGVQIITGGISRVE